MMVTVYRLGDFCSLDRDL